MRTYGREQLSCLELTADEVCARVPIDELGMKILADFQSAEDEVRIRTLERTSCCNTVTAILEFARS